MRRSKGSLGSLNPLAAAVGINNVVAFPGVGFTPTRAEAPPATATVGNAALALDPVLEDVPMETEEPAEERVGVERPGGVSDQVLLEAWHRLHTPYASVAGTKRKGVIRRVNVATSGIHKPKAYSPLLNQTVRHPSAYVVGMQETLNGLLRSAESRYLSDHKQVQDMIDPRAEEYVYERHLEKTEVWFPLIAMYQQAAEDSHRHYDFKMNLERRRLERDDIPWDGPEGPGDAYSYTPLGFMGPLKPAANDASVVAVDVQKARSEYLKEESAKSDGVLLTPPFIGPSYSLPCRDDIPVRSWDAWSSARDFYHKKKQRELEQTFNAHNYKQNTQSSKYTQSAEMPTTHNGVPERSYMAYKNTHEYYRRKREAEYTRLFDEEDRLKKEVRMLAETYVKFVKHKWNASPEFMQKMQAAFDEQISNKRIYAQNSRALRYRYRLRSLRSKNVRTQSYEAIPFVDFIRLYSGGHDLPKGKHVEQKAVVTMGKRRPATTWSNQALSRVYSKVIASVNEAKAAVRAKAIGFKKAIFGGIEYEMTNGGVLLPVDMVELPPEPGW